MYAQGFRQRQTIIFSILFPPLIKPNNYEWKELAQPASCSSRPNTHLYIMKYFYSLLVLLCASLLPQRGWAQAIEEGFYRIQLNPNQGYITVHQNTALHYSPNSNVSSTDAAFVWKFKKAGETWAVIHVATGKMVGNVTRNFVAHPLSDVPGFFYIKNNVQQGCVAIGNNSLFHGNTSWHKDGSNRIVTWEYKAPNSQWKLHKLNSTEVQTLLDQNANYASNISRAEAKIDEQFSAHQSFLNSLPANGQTLRILNRSYRGRALATMLTNDKVVTRENNANDYSQVFELERTDDGTLWALRNVVSQKYVGRKAGTSKTYLMTDAKEFFRLGTNKVNDTTFYTFEGSEHGLHDAKSQGHDVVGWGSNSEASQWKIVSVNLNDEQLQEQREKYLRYVTAKNSATDLHNRRHELTEQLRTYFDNDACTVLKDPYRSQSVESLREALQRTSLPLPLQEMILRVRSQKWNQHSTEANTLEKRFRIDDFSAYSDPYKWKEKRLAGTSYAFSQLTSPTGITIPAGESVQIYVNSAPNQHCSLEAELVEGFSPRGLVTPLTQGFNSIFSSDERHLYIRYNINDTTTLLKDCPAITIHIEGGRVNGYYDRFKDTDATWEAMKAQRDQGFLKDEVFRMKSRCYVISNHRDDVLNSENRGQWTFRGVKKSLSDVLAKMDSVSLLEQDMTGVDQFYDKFNCPHFYASNSKLYATSHGVWMGQGLISYQMYTHLNENNEGGNLWALAHETGHHFQDIIDLQGCLESSNNMFSTVAIWKLGGTVSRGGPMSNYFNNFYEDQPWVERSISARIRMYYQLWQYYELLGHHPNFYQELSNLFRKDPIRHGNADTDYLHFARTVCDLVKEDLTDFFTFHGFFSKKKIGERIPVLYGDHFYDVTSGYPKLHTTIREEDIKKTLDYLKKYEKKGAANLFFMDDRIRPSIDEKTGEPRTSCSRSATIGDAREVGDVGMYTDFNATVLPAPTQVKVDGRKVYVRSKGAVGYKVYDKSDKLIFVSNHNNFFLPETINLEEMTIKVAGGNGKDEDIVVQGKVVKKYDHYQALNTTGLALSTSESAPENLFYVCNGYDNESWLSNTAAKTTKHADNRAQLALFASNEDNAFYILRITRDTKEWLTYTETNIQAGRNKIKWLPLAEKAQARPWFFSRDEKGKGFDIFPIFPNGQVSDLSWNWHGGAGTENPLGFYSSNNDQSVWQFIPKKNFIPIMIHKGNNGNFATLCLPYPIKLSPTLKAYTGVKEGNYLRLSPLTTGNIVPSHTPVLLQSESADFEQITALPTTHAALPTVWEGAYYTIPNDELDKEAYSYYALTKRADGTIVLGLVGSANIPKSRAYLRVPNVRGARRLFHINFSPIITEIRTPILVPTEREEGVLYDLTGRRVTGNKPGIYIRDKQRILVR